MKSIEYKEININMIADRLVEINAMLDDCREVPFFSAMRESLMDEMKELNVINDNWGAGYAH